MQRLALFLALLIAAFLLGRVTAPAMAPQHARALSELEGTLPRRPTPVRPQPSGVTTDPTPSVERSRHRAADFPEPTPIAPSESAPMSDSVEGHGFLEIRNPEDVNDLELRGRNLRGKWVDVDLDLGTNPVRIELRSGPYQLRASNESEPGPRFYRMTIESGSTFVVDLAAAPTPDLYPLEPGLGRLDVEVTDTRGSPLPEVKVSLSVHGDMIEDHTGAGGRARFDVVPGRYRIAAGAFTRLVSIRAGRTQALHVDGRSTGEIDLAGIMYCHASVKALDGVLPPENVLGLDGVVRLVLLEPGRYEIYCHVMPSQRIHLDTVLVAAGRRVRIAPDPPGVFVRFRFPCPGGNVHQLRLRIESTDGEVIGPSSWSLGAVLFKRGRYTAIVDDKNWASDPVPFAAESDQVVVTLPVRARPQPPR